MISENYLKDCRFLSAQWAGMRAFTVVEPSLGHGEFFLSLWSCWREDSARCERLHVVSWVQQLPTRASLMAVLVAEASGVPVILRESFVDAMPFNLPGVHRLDFESGAVTLTLFVGPAISAFEQLRGPVDAFRGETGWCVKASEIARSLGREVTGVVQGTLTRRFGLSSVWDARDRAPDRRAIVIGAGFAGLGVAHSLASRGWKVSVFDQDGMRASTHHGHLAAALTPQVSRDDNQRARLSRAGTMRALANWRDAPRNAVTPCGAIQLERTSGRIVDLRSMASQLDCPSDWLRYVEKQEASELAGMRLDRGGLWFAQARRVQPRAFLAFLASNLSVAVAGARVARIFHQNGEWQVYGQGSQGRDSRVVCLGSAPKLVLANSAGVKGLLAESGYLSPESRMTGLHALGGEVSVLPSSTLGGGPKCIIAGDGYVLPEIDGFCVVGSTYLHDPQVIHSSIEGAQSNVSRAANLLAKPELSTSVDFSRISGWAGFRAVLPGRLPAIGPVFSSVYPPGLWVANAYASRGLTWSALAGDIISAAFEGEPIPLETELLTLLNPN